MSLTPEFIRSEVEKKTYRISIHADDERLADGLRIVELEFALKVMKHRNYSGCLGERG
jgi:hypothetical protein